MKRKLNLFFFLLSTVTVVYSTSAEPVSSDTWVISTVCSGYSGDAWIMVGKDNSIAVDSNNKVHISYNYYYGNISWQTDNKLQYVTNVSGSWEYTTLSDQGIEAGLCTDIAIDSRGKVHISYLGWQYIGGRLYQFLMYTTNLSDSWVTSTIDNTGIVGEYTSIAIDSNNKVHISYYDATNADLKYATNLSGSWVTSTIDSIGDVGTYTSIAIDSNNKVHISYYDVTNADLKYATNLSGSWVTSTVDSTVYNVGKYTSIARDSNNKVHISYYDVANADLKYATNSSGSWVTSTIDNAGDVGTYTSIARDSNNKMHISYYDATNADLKYATNLSGSWILSTIDSIGDVGTSTSIAIDLENKVHISYYDDTNVGLKYAKKILTTGIHETPEVNIFATYFSLSQNYPNPFNPTTMISFVLPKHSFTSLKVFDLIGREAATLVYEELSSGTYSYQWNASAFSSGIYFYRLQAGSFVGTKKLLLLK